MCWANFASSPQVALLNASAEDHGVSSTPRAAAEDEDSVARSGMVFQVAMLENEKQVRAATSGVNANIAGCLTLRAWPAELAQDLEDRLSSVLADHKQLKVWLAVRFWWRLCLCPLVSARCGADLVVVPWKLHGVAAPLPRCVQFTALVAPPLMHLLSCSGSVL